MPKPPPPAPTFDWRDRVLELRRIAPADLADHPLQHKQHPASQEAVMRGVLGEVGIADVLRAYVSPATGKLTAIDGHLRKSLGLQPWPTLILDVDDDEAAYLLATYDEIAGLAHKDAERLDRLLRQVQSGDGAVQQLLSDIAQNNGLYLDAPPTLDELADEYGDADANAEAFWKTISLKVPPETWTQFTHLMAALPGASEAERFAALLAQAEA